MGSRHSQPLAPGSAASGRASAKWLNADATCAADHDGSRLVIGKFYRPALQPLTNGCGLQIHRASGVSEPELPAQDHVASHGAPSRCGFCRGGSDPGEVCVVWEMDVEQVFHATDVSRSPCGSNTRLSSPDFYLPVVGSPSPAEASPASNHNLTSSMGQLVCGMSPAAACIAASPSSFTASTNPSDAPPAVPPQTTLPASRQAVQTSPLLQGALAGAECTGAEVASHMPKQQQAPKPAFAAMQDALTASSVEARAGSNVSKGSEQRSTAAIKGGDGIWHLEWALFDHSDSHVSLYLCHTPGNLSLAPPETNGQKRQSFVAVSQLAAGATGQLEAAENVGSAAAEPLMLSWHVVVQGLSNQTEEAVVHKEAYVPMHDYSLRSGEAGEPRLASPCWGIQGMLTLDDLDALTATQLLRVTIRLRHVAASQGDEAREPTPSSTGSREASSGEGATPIPAAMAPPSPRPLRVLAASLSPRILVVDNFLEPEICQQLVALAIPRLVRSRVSTGTETPSRVSHGTFFTGAGMSLPLIQLVEERIGRLVAHPAVIGGKKRLVNTEALQVVSYGRGGFYHGHFDNRAGVPVSRHATILIYLCDCAQGGGTYFPRATAPPTAADLPPGMGLDDLALMSMDLHEDTHVKRPGLCVNPVMGRAVIFWSALPNGNEDLASLHEAEPVVDGEKWIATRWFKEVE